MSEELIEDLILIIESIDIIEDRTQDIKEADNFVTSPRGLLIFDSVVMRLQSIGELIKNIDKFNPGLFNKYKQMDWNEIIKLRDLIPHHYHDLDNEIIFDICKKDITSLKIVIEQIIKENQ